MLMLQVVSVYDYDTGCLCVCFCYRKSMCMLMIQLCMLLLQLGCDFSFLLGMDKVLGFGVLVRASAPGGGGSNVWTYMIGGDIDLSITMTLISKALALGES